VPSNATNFFLRIFSAVIGSFSVGMGFYSFSAGVYPQSPYYKTVRSPL
jgi:hypothetical protein